MNGKLAPGEPIEIAAEPQFFVDDHIVDNHCKTMRVESDADTWEAGQWRHVAVMIGDQGLQMYVDGRLQGGGDASATIRLDAMNAGSFHIGSGSAWNEGDYGFRGAIRDIRLRGR